MYELITPPALEPFTLGELKGAMRIDHDSEDDLVMRLGIAARRLVERRLGLAIFSQSWRLTHQGVPAGLLTLRPGRVRSVTSVELRYGGADFGPSVAWRLVRSVPAGLELTAPARDGAGALKEVRVTFESGLGDIADVPEDLRRAIIMLAAHYYENREAVGEGRYVAMPLSVETILLNFREVSL